jgi:hypothetical protein
MTDKKKSFCNSCERNRVSNYWPCQIPREERANYDRCHAEELGYEHRYIPIPNIKENKAEKPLEKEREQAKRNLETACEILGWDNDHLLHILQTKQFLRACRDAENLGVFDFEHAMTLVANAGRLNPYLRQTNELIGDYIAKLKDGKLSGLNSERIGTYDSVKYAERMKERISELSGIKS